MSISRVGTIRDVLITRRTSTSDTPGCPDRTHVKTVNYWNTSVHREDSETKKEKKKKNGNYHNCIGSLTELLICSTKTYIHLFLRFTDRKSSVSHPLSTSMKFRCYIRNPYKQWLVLRSQKQVTTKMARMLSRTVYHPWTNHEWPTHLVIPFTPSIRGIGRRTPHGHTFPWRDLRTHLHRWDTSQTHPLREDTDQRDWAGISKGPLGVCEEGKLKTTLEDGVYMGWGFLHTLSFGKNQKWELYPLSLRFKYFLEPSTGIVYVHTYGEQISMGEPECVLIFYTRTVSFIVSS